jgi:hypothetical protein
MLYLKIRMIGGMKMVERDHGLYLGLLDRGVGVGRMILDPTTQLWTGRGERGIRTLF